MLEHKEYCPVCTRAWYLRDGRDAADEKGGDGLECTECGMWVHFACEGVDGSETLPGGGTSFTSAPIAGSASRVRGSIYRRGSAAAAEVARGEVACGDGGGWWW